MKVELSTLQEFPCVRYRAPKEDVSTTTKFDMVPKWLATAVWDIVSKYKSTIPEFPQKETCELLIVDRPIDQVLKHTLNAKTLIHYNKELQFIHYSLQQFHMNAKIAPVIHEWTYDAMCHDLLEMDGNKYIYEVIVISY